MNAHWEEKGLNNGTLEGGVQKCARVGVLRGKKNLNRPTLQSVPNN